MVKFDFSDDLDKKRIIECFNYLFKKLDDIHSDICYIRGSLSKDWEPLYKGPNDWS